MEFRSHLVIFRLRELARQIDWFAARHLPILAGQDVRPEIDRNAAS
jgi:hypothetical protein